MVATRRAGIVSCAAQAGAAVDAGTAHANAHGAMRILLESESSVLVEIAPGPHEVVGEGGGHGNSPFHMLAAGLALCTLSALYSWAMHAGIDPTPSLRVRWELAEAPRRIGTIEVEVIWPGLPEGRRHAVLRVVEACPIHASFTHPPALRTVVAT